MTIKENKKDVRFKSIHAYFKKMNPSAVVYDMYQAYILDVIINLGDVYDDNHEEIQALLRAGKQATGRHKDPELCKLYTREDHLNRIGRLLRDAVGINVKENRKKYTKRPLSATEIMSKRQVRNVSDN